MESIILKNKYYQYKMALDGKDLLHVGFFPTDFEKEPDVEEIFNRSWPKPHEAVVTANSESYGIPHSKRAYPGPVSERAKFSRHEQKPVDGGIDHIMVSTDPKTGLELRYHYVVYEDSPALVRYTEVVNRSDREVILEHVSGFCLNNFPYFGGSVKDIYLHQFKSLWIYEGNHYVTPMPELEVYDNSRTAFSVDGIGTAVCKDHIPFFIIEQRTDNLFIAVQLEQSESWRFEIGNCEPHNGKNPRLYSQGGMTNVTYGAWSNRLAPEQSFVTPKVSLAVTCGTYEDAVNLMHLHRERKLIHRSIGDRNYPIIYNDWLFLQGKNNEENIIKQLDTLKDIGADVYVTDDGWHVGWGKSLWTGLGRWEYDEERFPHGMKYVADEIKKRGLRAGIWCEIECLGEDAPNYSNPEMLLMRNGYFVTDAGHRFLNFTKQCVRDYADRIFDRFAEWGFEYVKIDYNTDCIPGADNCGSDNPIQGIHLNRIAYDAWLEGVRFRHPEMIIENCSSGGMRLEYNSLSRADMCSISDQSDYRLLGSLAYNVTKFIHPSQCGVWSWTDAADGTEDFILAMTNSMIGRMHICGDFAALSPEKKALLKEACGFYKQYCHILGSCRTYHHTDPLFYYRNSDSIHCTELRSSDDTETVLVVQRIGAEQDSITVKLVGLESGMYTVKCYPHTEPQTFTSDELAEKGCTVAFPATNGGRVIYIKKI